MVLTVIILVYVDDLVVFGDILHIQRILQKPFLVFLVKETGHLNEDGANARFIGRVLQIRGDGILIYEDQEYFNQVRNEFDLIDCKETSTAATSRAVLTPD